LALVEEVFGPELLEPSQVGVGVGTQPEGVAGGLHRGDVVVGVDQFHDLVVQLHQGDFGVTIAEQVAHDWALGHGLWRQAAGAFTSSAEFLVDGVFGGPATAASTVAAVHLGSLVEHRGLFSAQREGTRWFSGLEVCGRLMPQAVPGRCHFHVTTGCGVVGWTWGVKSNRLLTRVTPVSAAWWWRVVWKELCHVESDPCFWVWCWVGSGGWFWVGVVGDRVGWATAGVGSGGAA